MAADDSHTLKAKSLKKKGQGNSTHNTLKDHSITDNHSIIDINSGSKRPHEHDSSKTSKHAKKRKHSNQVMDHHDLINIEKKKSKRKKKKKKTESDAALALIGLAKGAPSDEDDIDQDDKNFINDQDIQDIDEKLIVKGLVESDDVDSYAIESFTEKDLHTNEPDHNHNHNHEVESSLENYHVVERNPVDSDLDPDSDDDLSKRNLTQELVHRKTTVNHHDPLSTPLAHAAATTLGDALNIDPNLLTAEQLNEMQQFLNGIAPEAQAIARAAEAQRIAAAAVQAAASAAAVAVAAAANTSNSTTSHHHLLTNSTNINSSISKPSSSSIISTKTAQWKAPPRKIPKGMTSATTMATIDMDDIEHHEILTKRWLNPAQLQQLVEQRNLKYKKGKFSAAEDQLLEQALHQYQIEHNLDKDELIEIIFAKGKKARETYSNFWSTITTALTDRPIIAVYHHVRRLYHPMNHQGTWSNDEDTRLKDLVNELGQAWEAISQRIGRMSSDCRDRWRNHVKDSDTRKTGPWSSEEEEELARIVHEMTTEQGKSSDTEVFWSVVSERMKGTRTRQQCRIKWTDSLNKKVKNAGHKPRWSERDSYILIQKLRSLPVTHDSEIDWKQLPDPTWNLWSAHQLQRHWTRFKAKADPEKLRSFQDILRELADEQDKFPKDWLESPTTTMRIRSAEFVTDDDEMEEDDDPNKSAKDLNELMCVISANSGTAI